MPDGGALHCASGRFLCNARNTKYDAAMKSNGRRRQDGIREMATEDGKRGRPSSARILRLRGIQKSSWIPHSSHGFHRRIRRIFRMEGSPRGLEGVSQGSLGVFRFATRRSTVDDGDVLDPRGDAIAGRGIHEHRCGSTARPVHLHSAMRLDEEPPFSPVPATVERSGPLRQPPTPKEVATANGRRRTRLLPTALDRSPRPGTNVSTNSVRETVRRNASTTGGGTSKRVELRLLRWKTSRDSPSCESSGTRARDGRSARRVSENAFDRTKRSHAWSARPIPSARESHRSLDLSQSFGRP